jgi:hypothetical protein
MRYWVSYWLLSSATAPWNRSWSLRWRFGSWIFPLASSFAAEWTRCLHHKVVVLSGRRYHWMVFDTLWMNWIHLLHNILILLWRFPLTHDFKILLWCCLRGSWRLSNILFIALTLGHGFTSDPQNRTDILFHLDRVLLVNVVILLFWDVALLQEI